MIAVFIAKKLRKRRTCAACRSKMIANESTIKKYKHLRNYRKEVWFSLLLRHTILCFKPLAYYKISPVGFILTTIHNRIENKSVKGVDEEIQVT